MIYDLRREKAVLHKRGVGWILLEEVKEEELGRMLSSREEDRFDELWKSFHQAIGIESRKNPGLQQNMLPFKFRPYMNEFNQNNS